MCKRVELTKKELFDSYSLCFPCDLGEENPDDFGEENPDDFGEENPDDFCEENQDNVRKRFDQYLKGRQVYAYDVGGTKYWFSIKQEQNMWVLQDVCKVKEDVCKVKETEDEKPIKKMKTEKTEKTENPTFASAFQCALRDMKEDVKKNLVLVTEYEKLIDMYEKLGFFILEDFCKDNVDFCKCLDVETGDTIMKYQYPRIKGGGASGRRNVVCVVFLLAATILGGIFHV